MSLGNRHGRYCLTVDVVLFPIVGVGLIGVALIAALLGSVTFNEATIAWKETPAMFAALVGGGIVIGGVFVAYGVIRFVRSGRQPVEGQRRR